MAKKSETTASAKKKKVSETELNKLQRHLPSLRKAAEAPPERVLPTVKVALSLHLLRRAVRLQSLLLLQKQHL